MSLRNGIKPEDCTAQQARRPQSEHLIVCFFLTTLLDERTVAKHGVSVLSVMNIRNRLTYLGQMNNYQRIKGDPIPHN
jgi:hypothetical protein